MSGLNRPTGDGNPYRGATVVFATQHHKHEQAAAPFREHLGASVVSPDDIDTDQFGTFTGETPRTLSPRDTALAKAQLGIARTGHPYALASEATYSTSWPTATHHELLLFLDQERSITITENAIVPARSHDTIRLTDPNDAADAAERFGFPTTHAVVVAYRGQTVLTHKGIDSIPALTAAVAASWTADTDVLIGPDHRAHADPARQQVIASLADRMAIRLTRPCPWCAAPGWGSVAVVRGVPCATCGTPTGAVAADSFGCAACDAADQVPRGVPPVSAEWCDACNP